MARFEAVILNGKHGSAEVLHMESTYALGGSYCYESTAKLHLQKGLTVARVKDNKKDEIFWLKNVNWG